MQDSILHIDIEKFEWMIDWIDRVDALEKLRSDLSADLLLTLESMEIWVKDITDKEDLRAKISYVNKKIKSLKR